MAGIGNPFHRVRLVFQRSSIPTKIAVLAVVVLSIITLLTLRFVILEQKAQINALREQAISLEQENQRLQEKIDGLDTIDGISQIAKDELGLVDPDTIIFEPEQ